MMIALHWEFIFKCWNWKSSYFRFGLDLIRLLLFVIVIICVQRHLLFFRFNFHSCLEFVENIGFWNWFLMRQFATSYRILPFILLWPWHKQDSLRRGYELIIINTFSLGGKGWSEIIHCACQSPGQLSNLISNRCSRSILYLATLSSKLHNVIIGILWPRAWVCVCV